MHKNKQPYRMNNAEIMHIKQNILTKMKKIWYNNTKRSAFLVTAQKEGWLYDEKDKGCMY